MQLKMQSGLMTLKRLQNNMLYLTGPYLISNSLTPFEHNIDCCATESTVC